MTAPIRNWEDISEYKLLSFSQGKTTGPLLIDDIDNFNANIQFATIPCKSLTIGYKEVGTTQISQYNNTQHAKDRMSYMQKIKEYECILDEKNLEKWIKILEEKTVIAVDTETSSLNPLETKLIGISLSYAPNKACYIPLAHKEKSLKKEIVLKKIKSLLEDPSIKKVGQNIKFDFIVLKQNGIEINPIEDTMLISYTLDAGINRHNMDTLSEIHLGHKTITFKELVGSGKNKLNFADIELVKATEYAAEDADITLQLHEYLYPQIQAVPTLLYVFTHIDMPLVPILSLVERQGALVDGRMLKQHGAELADRLKELVEQAWEQAGETFNLDSPKQLQTIFYEKLGLPILKKTPGGKPSTAEAVLVDLARDYELPATLLNYRGLAKLKSTYTDKLPLDINAETGRIHTSYHQAVTATGRLSSSDPNLQNIPIRNAEGRRVRQAFVPPPGYKIMAADYSQIELRIMAHLSGDSGLTTAFAEDQDIHRATASEVFDVAPDAVSDDQRRSAKAINFGLIYGMSAFGLGKQLSISRTLAQDYIDRYFSRYPGVLRYMEETKALAAEQGFVETVFGRRLYLPEINAKAVPRRQAAERTAINAPMQGTAADIIKLAMRSVQDWLVGADLDARMILQVHDELVFEVSDKDLQALTEEVVQRMCGAVELSVPLTVATGVGMNWDEAH